MPDPSPPNVAALRQVYARAALTEADAPDAPLPLFAAWFEEAMNAGTVEPNAMTLATADAEGRPSARIVLLKGFDQRGFTFFTNLASRKGSDLAANPHAALVFWWPPLERQVRIEGRIEHVEEPEADAYFASRPRGSRLGAWASPQSRPLPDRAALERRLADTEAAYPGDADVPRPPFWGGFRIVPFSIEFWQGRPNRLHDRLFYQADGHGGWTRERLAP